ncbi:MAG TPA: hypothetical protein VKB93_09515 [Thermoanaerobaculia bacterium]|nr:hypothetical protein [Thermoanaerobaculia bacterium]
MRHYRNAAESIDVAAIINAGLALRDLAMTDARMHDVFTSFVHEALTDGRRHSASIFIMAAAVYMERGQRVARRFRTWRASKCAVPPLLGKPDPIGTQTHPVRRWRRDSFDVNAVLSTVLAVRALDREEETSRERDFVTTLALAYDGWTSPFIWALLAYAERDRRFARRFRSWRRSKAAQAAAPEITPPPSGARPRRKTR